MVRLRRNQEKSLRTCKHSIPLKCKAVPCSQWTCLITTILRIYYVVEVGDTSCEILVGFGEHLVHNAPQLSILRRMSGPAASQRFSEQESDLCADHRPVQVNVVVVVATVPFGFGVVQPVHGSVSSDALFIAIRKKQTAPVDNTADTAQQQTAAISSHPEHLFLVKAILPCHLASC
eukprot:TRINITY_DN44393_c0_g1_i1.p1 TRINITY_DN44393_c0_g1~~TRINITY_DN44393_c0_g1_i1.p1  ORF type:complete len:176 (+),score=18.27 TRINITY_DN44393_c0_g1_i1:119-646(+)